MSGLWVKHVSSTGIASTECLYMNLKLIFIGGLFVLWKTAEGKVVWGLHDVFVMPLVDLQGKDLEFDSAADQETYQPKAFTEIFCLPFGM